MPTLQNLTDRIQLADETDCPNCTSQLAFEHFYTLEKVTFLEDTTYYHARCPECGNIWDEYTGWD